MYKVEVNYFDSKDNLTDNIVKSYSTWTAKVTGKLPRFIVRDWAHNQPFPEYDFVDFEEAEEFLCNYFDLNNLDYDELRGEYVIDVVIPSRVPQAH